MDYKEKKLKEFEQFSENREIEYDFPLYQHSIYDDIKLFISKVLEEQEKYLNNECAKSIAMMGAEFKKKIEEQEKRLSEKQIKCLLNHWEEWTNSPEYADYKRIIALQPKKRINNG